MSSSDKYVEAGTEGQFEDDVRERHWSGGMFSSEEVSSMTSDQFISVMMDAGEQQRVGLGMSGNPRAPESYAIGMGASSGQGKRSAELGRTNWIDKDYGRALENVGDVYHRMTAAPSPPGNPAGNLWKPSGKSRDALAALERASIHAEYFDPSEEQREWGKGYSEAHAQLPVYTPVQQLANQSAIHLGKHQFGPSMEALGTMRNMEIAHNEAQPEPEVEVKVDPDTGEEVEWTTYHTNPDTEYNRGMSQPASVEFLRSQGR